MLLFDICHATDAPKYCLKECLDTWIFWDSILFENINTIIRKKIKTGKEAKVFSKSRYEEG